MKNALAASKYLMSRAQLAGSLLLLTVAGCKSESLLCCSPPSGTAGLRVVNAFTTPVDVLVDGNVVASSLPAGLIFTTRPTDGAHTLALRPTGAGGTVSQSITISDGALNTIAAVRTSTGVLAATALDDTGSVVPPGATKVRVMHLAPNAGELQVYRTQPDYQQPTPWQFPFTYQAQHDDLSAPFFQSTPGTWEIRVWQTPADASGWANATVTTVLNLAAGEKKTVLILDNPGAGVHLTII